MLSQPLQDVKIPGGPRTPFPRESTQRQKYTTPTHQCKVKAQQHLSAPELSLCQGEVLHPLSTFVSGYVEQLNNPRLRVPAPHSHTAFHGAAAPRAGSLPKPFQPRVIQPPSSRPSHLPAPHQAEGTMCGLFAKRGFGGLKQIVRGAQDSGDHSVGPDGPARTAPLKSSSWRMRF